MTNSVGKMKGLNPLQKNTFNSIRDDEKMSPNITTCSLSTDSASYCMGYNDLTHVKILEFNLKNVFDILEMSFWVTLSCFCQR